LIDSTQCFRRWGQNLEVEWSLRRYGRCCALLVSHFMCDSWLRYARSASLVWLVIGCVWVAALAKTP